MQRKSEYLTWISSLCHEGVFGNGIEYLMVQWWQATKAFSGILTILLGNRAWTLENMSQTLFFDTIFCNTLSTKNMPRKKAKCLGIFLCFYTHGNSCCSSEHASAYFLITFFFKASFLHSRQDRTGPCKCERGIKRENTVRLPMTGQAQCPSLLWKDQPFSHPLVAVLYWSRSKE